MKLEFKTYGVTQIKGLMSRVGKGIQDFHPAWKKIANDFFDVAETKLFASKGHGKWAALSTKYAAWKSKNYPGRPILVLSGDLRESLTSGNEDTINLPSPLVLRLGTRNKLGIIHFDGYEEGNLPSRRTIDLRPQDSSRWMKIIQTYVSKLVGGLK